MNMGYRGIFDKPPELGEFCEYGRLLDGFYSGSTRSWVIHGGSETLIACSGNCDVNYRILAKIITAALMHFIRQKLVQESRKLKNYTMPRRSMRLRKNPELRRCRPV
ncbi:hypothetical protein GNX71_17355 [Variovorax sp. RKNM96]|uniref:hypothetical protein n=1 Tax=Variovorax sp. RKNM96 TaxID=2681552 RepID=UPI00197E3AC1|nr:hypothetical protein [Variovorax sp. RKNM96]QSI31248.1 hypothetical protein GNX71_17355 [Variovorax sp. RKNM96]